MNTRDPINTFPPTIHTHANARNKIIMTFGIPPANPITAIAQTPAQPKAIRCARRKEYRTCRHAESTCNSPQPNGARTGHLKLKTGPIPLPVNTTRSPLTVTSHAPALRRHAAKWVGNSDVNTSSSKPTAPRYRIRLRQPFFRGSVCWPYRLISDSCMHHTHFGPSVTTNRVLGLKSFVSG